VGAKVSSLISHFSAYVHAHFRDGFNFGVVVVVVVLGGDIVRENNEN
jgi:hypothetical protein